MGFDDICNTSLVLGLGFPSNTMESPSSKTSDNPQKSKNPTVVMATSNNSLEPSLTLGLSGDQNAYHVLSKKIVVPAAELCSQASPNSAVSSFSNASVKRERDPGSEEVEIERVSQRAINDEDEDSVNTRKKLRLTKEQSAFLEDSFKQHSTLNPKQKQALARQLNLRPRQIEVWFQNRRARTKLKQTEVDCEFLKKCCETLTDENRKLHKELQELKALKLAQPFYMQIPAAATLSMCPSCERIGCVGDGASNKTPFAKPHHFFKPFNNPSAAC